MIKQIKQMTVIPRNEHNAMTEASVRGGRANRAGKPMETLNKCSMDETRDLKLQLPNCVIFGKPGPQLSYLQTGDNNIFQTASQSFYENQLKQNT